MKRPHILLSAFYFSPYRGSESGVGWNVATQLAKHFDVTALTGDVAPSRPHEADLQRWQAEGAVIPGLTIAYVPPSRATILIERLHTLPGLKYLWYKAYQGWQKKAYQRAVELHRQTPFTLAHHLNVIGFREPGYLWKLPIPFVWGPIAGGPMVPWSYMPMLGFKDGLRWGMRNLGNIIQKSLPSRSRQAARKASHIWTVTPEDHAMVTRQWGAQAQPMIETGTNPDPTVLPKPAVQGPYRLIWSGIHDAGKALPLLLQALAQLPKSYAWHLDILGEGPCRARWRKMATALQLQDQVTWHGWVQRPQALALMQTGHILVHTSLKEGTPHVVLEALALGMPVLCHDACGMGTVVNDTCGRKVPLVNPATSIAGFTAGLTQFFDDAELLPRLSAGALVRARELSWEHKVQAIVDVYRNIVECEKSC